LPPSRLHTVAPRKTVGFVSQYMGGVPPSPWSTVARLLENRIRSHRFAALLPKANPEPRLTNWVRFWLRFGNLSTPAWPTLGSFCIPRPWPPVPRVVMLRTSKHLCRPLPYVKDQLHHTTLYPILHRYICQSNIVISLALSPSILFLVPSTPHQNHARHFAPHGGPGVIKALIAMEYGNVCVDCLPKWGTSAVGVGRRGPQF